MQSLSNTFQCSPSALLNAVECSFETVPIECSISKAVSKECSWKASPVGLPVCCWHELSCERMEESPAFAERGGVGYNSCHQLATEHHSPHRHPPH